MSTIRSMETAWIWVISIRSFEGLRKKEAFGFRRTPNHLWVSSIEFSESRLKCSRYYRHFCYTSCSFCVTEDRTIHFIRFLRVMLTDILAHHSSFPFHWYCKLEQRWGSCQGKTSCHGGGTFCYGFGPFERCRCWRKWLVSPELVSIK